MSYNDTKPEDFNGDTRDFRRYVRALAAEVEDVWKEFVSSCDLTRYTPLEESDLEVVTVVLREISENLSRKNWGD